VTVSQVLADFGHLALLFLRSPQALTAENLFLRRQLALFEERRVKPDRATGRHPLAHGRVESLVRVA